MAWNVEYQGNGDNIVRLTATGTINSDDLRAQVEKIVALVKQTAAKAVLADYSEALSDVPLSTLYWVPDYATELGAPWHIPTALISPRSRYRIESYQFLELVARNAGYNLRLFDEPAAAREWLGQSSQIQSSTDALALAQA